MVRHLAVLLVLGAFSATPATLAQPAQDSVEERLAHLQDLRPDPEVLKRMTRDERRAAMQEWKATVEAEAARLGIEKSGGGYQPLETPRAVEGRAPLKVLGTIQYDSGNVTGIAGIASQMVGNRFDSAATTGGVCCAAVPSSGSVTMITFDMVNTFFGSVVFSIYSNIVGTMAAQVTSMARPGIMTGLNTLGVMSPTTANAYMNGAFLAGIWQFDPTMTGLGVDTGTTAGQGHKGISLNDGAAGSMLTTLTGINAVFRVSGDLLTPIELVDFEIED